MNNAWVYSICGLVATGALATGIVVTSGNKRATAEAIAKTARSEERAQTAKAKQAEEATKAKEAEKKAVAEAKAAKAEERAAKEAELEAEKEKTKQAEAETAAKKAEERAAAEKAKTVQAEAEKARAEADKARAVAAKAEAERDAKKADAERAEAERLAQEMAAKTVKVALALETLRKGEYEKLLAETKAFKEELDERERQLRPPKTVKDLLMEQDEGGDLFAEDEYDDAPVAGFTRQKRKAKRILPENDRTLPRESRRLARVERETVEAVVSASAETRSNLVARLEGLMKRAIEEDRVPDAEFYMHSIKGLYPDYVPEKK